MPTITCNLEKDERMGWSTYAFKVDGKTILGLTSETGEAKAQKLKTVCEDNADELLKLVTASDEARARNMELLKVKSRGKDWPAFKALEKFRDKLLKEAGIRNT